METSKQIGLIIAIMITGIIGLVLFQAIAQEQGKTVTTIVSGNVTYTAPAAGQNIDLAGQDLIGTPIVLNATSGATVPASNYTIAEGVSSTTSVKSIIYTSNAGPFAGTPVNISYTYGGDGYIDDAGARSVSNLIVLLTAIAIAMIALIGLNIGGIKDLIKN